MPIESARQGACRPWLPIAAALLAASSRSSRGAEASVSSAFVRFRRYRASSPLVRCAPAGRLTSCRSPRWRIPASPSWLPCGICAHGPFPSVAVGCYPCSALRGGAFLFIATHPVRMVAWSVRLFGQSQNSNLANAEFEYLNSAGLSELQGPYCQSVRCACLRISVFGSGSRS